MFVFNLFSELPTVDRLRPDGLPARTRQGPSLPLARVQTLEDVYHASLARTPGNNTSKARVVVKQTARGLA